MGSVLVARKGKTIFNNSYGMADLEWSIPNSPTTRFNIASMTKQFTAAAILLLEDRGKLKTSDPVKKYLPDAPASWDNITIYHLLTHTSGISDDAAKYQPGPPDLLPLLIQAGPHQHRQARGLQGSSEFDDPRSAADQERAGAGGPDDAQSPGGRRREHTGNRQPWVRQGQGGRVPVHDDRDIAGRDVEEAVEASAKLFQALERRHRRVGVLGLVARGEGERVGLHPGHGPYSRSGCAQPISRSDGGRLCRFFLQPV